MSVVVLSKLKQRLRWKSARTSDQTRLFSAESCQGAELAEVLLNQSIESDPGVLENECLELAVDGAKIFAVLSPGSSVRIRWTGRCICTACGTVAKKLMSGFCFSCFQSRPQADTCVMSPENCHYLRGTCRESNWGLSFCFQPHVVYLSYTGDFKVGITRRDQLGYRWCDQGATWAAPLALVGSRFQAGVVENAVRARISDRTNWRRMLRDGNAVPPQDVWLGALKDLRLWLQTSPGFAGVRLRVSCPPSRPDAAQLEWSGAGPTVIQYRPPDDPCINDTSLSLEKSGEIGGQLLGFKGQYLFFSTGVINVRRHEGFEVDFAIE